MSDIDVNITPKVRTVFRTSETRRVEIISSKQAKQTHNLFLNSDIYHTTRPVSPDKDVINQLIQTERIPNKSHAYVFEDS